MSNSITMLFGDSMESISQIFDSMQQDAGQQSQPRRAKEKDTGRKADAGSQIDSLRRKQQKKKETQGKMVLGGVGEGGGKKGSIRWFGRHHLHRSNLHVCSPCFASCSPNQKFSLPFLLNVCLTTMRLSLA